jgi:hypothetical protein
MAAMMSGCKLVTAAVPCPNELAAMVPDPVTAAAACMLATDPSVALSSSLPKSSTLYIFCVGAYPNELDVFCKSIAVSLRLYALWKNV